MHGFVGASFAGIFLLFALAWEFVDSYNTQRHAGPSASGSDGQVEQKKKISENDEEQGAVEEKKSEDGGNDEVEVTAPRQTNCVPKRSI